jgi:hypothetical protein
MAHEEKKLAPRPACRVHGAVGTTRAGLLGTFAVLLALGACGRSPLDFAPLPTTPIIEAGTPPPVMDAATEPVADRPADRPMDLGMETKPDLRPDLAPDLPRDMRPDMPPVDRPPIDAGPMCQPQPETCNGRDDDCDGKVDQGLPAIPCPNGGARYCVAGVYSECPRRCEVCVPGSQRECFTSFCTFWGVQACASDGRSFGACREVQVPTACKAIAEKSMRSRALEQCCIDEGFCCLDEFDLNKNGDRTDMVGRCDTVMCSQ